MAIGTVAESAVLGVLAPGGMLTARQITAQTHLTTWSAHRALGHLRIRGLIMTTRYSGRWFITLRGRTALATRRRTGPR